MQYAAMELLVRRPGASQKAIGEDLGLDRSTVADVVRRMEAAGLLERSRDPDDNRRNVVVLTARGRTEYMVLTPAVVALQDDLVRDLTGDETAQLRRLIARVLVSHETAGAPSLPEARPGS
ncbi:MAG: marR [Naasia sp.]|nr:marR [Naasia sp.]